MWTAYEIPQGFKQTIEAQSRNRVMTNWASSKEKSKNPRIHNSNGPDFFLIHA